MGVLSALPGHAPEADAEDVEENVEEILAGDEQVERAFKLVRDLLIFTNRRFILVDRQGPAAARFSKCRRRWRCMWAGDVAPRPS